MSFADYCVRAVFYVDSVGSCEHRVVFLMFFSCFSTMGIRLERIYLSLFFFLTKTCARERESVRKAIIPMLDLF